MHASEHRLEGATLFLHHGTSPRHGCFGKTSKGNWTQLNTEEAVKNEEEPQLPSAWDWHVLPSAQCRTAIPDLAADDSTASNVCRSNHKRVDSDAPPLPTRIFVSR
jgi:hypothetical protein